MEYLRDLNNKQDLIDKENCTKLMYSCGQKETCRPTALSRIIGIVGLVAMLLFVTHRFLIARPRADHILDFTKNLEITKMFTMLLLLGNIKNLTNSLTANIILPVIQPIIPILSCSLRLFSIDIGHFVADVVIFI